MEGLDGCGKSTQFDLLRHNLDQHQIDYIAVREPGGTEAGEAIRKILLHNHYALSLQAELHLYMAARSELTEQVILPALHGGKVVLCDRFTDSTLAYQGYGGGADLEWIRLQSNKATRGIIPDLTFLFDLPAEEAAARRGASADRMEKKDLFFHRRVRRGYLEMARLEPNRIVIVDASLDIEEQAILTWKLVRQFNKKIGKRADHEL